MSRGGARPGAGRKPKAESLTVSAVRQYTTKRDWRELVKTLIRIGKEGDVSAIKTLLAYRDGQPAMAIQHSGSLEVDHIQTWSELKQECIERGLDPWLVRQEARKLLAEADEEDGDGDGEWVS